MKGCTPADDFPAASWLEIRVLPAEVPAAIRVRHALKRLLRDYGIRVVRVAGVPPEGVAERAEEITEEGGN